MRTMTCPGSGCGSGSSSSLTSSAPLDCFGTRYARIKRWSPSEKRPQSAVPPHDHTGDEQDCRDEPDDRPDRAQRLVVSPAPEVQPGHPRQDYVAGPLAILRVGIRPPVHEVRKRLRYPEVKP